MFACGPLPVNETCSAVKHNTIYKHFDNVPGTFSRII